MKFRVPKTTKFIGRLSDCQLFTRLHISDVTTSSGQRWKSEMFYCQMGDISKKIFSLAFGDKAMNTVFEAYL